MDCWPQLTPSSPGRRCVQVAAPHYPNAGNDRPPNGLGWMLRNNFIDHWPDLADLPCEEALHAISRPCRLVGVVDATALGFHSRCGIAFGYHLKGAHLKSRLLMPIELAASEYADDRPSQGVDCFDAKEPSFERFLFGVTYCPNLPT